MNSLHYINTNKKKTFIFNITIRAQESWKIKLWLWLFLLIAYVTGYFVKRLYLAQIKINQKLETNSKGQTAVSMSSTTVSGLVVLLLIIEEEIFCNNECHCQCQPHTHLSDAIVHIWSTLAMKWE